MSRVAQGLFVLEESAEDAGVYTYNVYVIKYARERREPLQTAKRDATAASEVLLLWRELQRSTSVGVNFRPVAGALRICSQIVDAVELLKHAGTFAPRLFVCK